MDIPEVRDFKATRACRELIKQGYTAVDDIGGTLYKLAEDELLDALGISVDAMDFVVDEVETDLGPVFVFRDASRISLEAVEARIQAARKFG